MMTKQKTVTEIEREIAEAKAAFDRAARLGAPASS
jgi:hypothetical protein